MLGSFTANARSSSNKIVDFQKAREAEATSKISESAGNTIKLTKSELKEMIKEALREELAAK